VRLYTIYRNGGWSRRLRAKDSTLRDAVTGAAAQALRDEIARRGDASVSIAADGARRSVGSVNPEDITREFGTLEQSPSPWLAPVLPPAREPMRAAATARMREIFAAHAGNKKAAARALSKRKS
jgi:hypothetical protein